MSKKTPQGERPQAPEYKTIRVWTLIKGILVVFALIGAYIFGSQTAIQGENRYNQDVVTQAQNLVKQLK